MGCGTSDRSSQSEYGFYFFWEGTHTHHPARRAGCSRLLFRTYKLKAGMYESQKTLGQTRVECCRLYFFWEFEPHSTQLGQPKNSNGCIPRSIPKETMTRIDQYQCQCRTETMPNRPQYQGSAIRHTVQAKRWRSPLMQTPSQIRKQDRPPFLWKQALQFDHFAVGQHPPLWQRPERHRWGWQLRLH